MLAYAKRSRSFTDSCATESSSDESPRPHRVNSACQKLPQFWVPYLIHRSGLEEGREPKSQESAKRAWNARRLANHDFFISSLPPAEFQTELEVLNENRMIVIIQ
jgi:hypothetical protein